MVVTIALGRALPLPPMQIAGREARFVPPDEGIPGDALVYVSTALDTIDAALIARLPDSVGLIANIGVGFDNIDLAAAARRGLKVSNTPVVAEDTADLAFALILAACRKLGEGERYLRAGSWSGTGASPPLGVRVNGATLGIVGFGAIGRAVARRAQGFGMKLLYTGRSENAGQGAILGAEYRPDLLAMLGECDIVTIHAPLREEPRHMFDAAAFAACKPGAVIINTARGPLVDEDALADALETGHIAAAGLDVFSKEPHVSQRLLDLEQVVLTSHIGSATAQCRTDMVMRGIANISRFIESGEVLDPVPLPEPGALS